MLASFELRRERPDRAISAIRSGTVCNGSTSVANVELFTDDIYTRPIYSSREKDIMAFKYKANGY